MAMYLEDREDSDVYPGYEPVKKCLRCRGLPDVYLEKRMVAVEFRRNIHYFVSVGLILALIAAFFAYWHDLGWRRRANEAYRQTVEQQLLEIKANQHQCAMNRGS
jgi:hypothetical protein